MPDNEKLTTTDIADQAKPEKRDQNGEMTRDATARDAKSTGNGEVALFDEGEANDLRRRWSDIQTTFVDRPKDSVAQADELVAQTIKQLAEGFAGERDNLEEIWSSGGDVSTEELRLALQRYRSFFERLLNA